MRENDVVVLEVPASRTADPFALLERKAEGKRVLNVGAGGGVQGYLPDNKEIWLHHRLGRVASHLVGIDIDREAIRYAAQHGVRIEEANCESASFDTPFDLVVLSDVIEHMNAPVVAIENLMRHLKPDGELCITTPNATAFSGFLKILLGQRLNYFWDHVATYTPDHIQAICDRVGCRMAQVTYFDHVDRRSAANLMKSWFARMISSVSPRFASSFLVVLRRREG